MTVRRDRQQAFVPEPAGPNRRNRRRPLTIRRRRALRADFASGAGGRCVRSPPLQGSWRLRRRLPCRPQGSERHSAPGASGNEDAGAALGLEGHRRTRVVDILPELLLERRAGGPEADVEKRAVGRVEVPIDPGIGARLIQVSSGTRRSARTGRPRATGSTSSGGTPPLARAGSSSVRE